MGAARQSLLDPVRWLLALQGVRADAIECFKGLYQNPVLYFIWLISWNIGICIGMWFASNLLHRSPVGSLPGFSPTGQPFSPTNMLPTPTCLAACFLSHPAFHINSLVHIHTDPGKHKSPACVYVTGSNGYIYCNLMILESPWKCTSGCFSEVIISWKA